MVPLLSVCIPSKNRHATLVHSIAAALELGPDVEVVVLDTGDEALSLDELGRLEEHHSAFTYEHVNQSLSFAETFDRVVNMATGRFVTVIGDDDAVLPSAVNLARRAEREGLDNITPTLPAVYNWPNFQHRYYGAADAGLLGLRPFTGGERYPVARDELLSSAAAGFQLFDALPRIYYGLVARSCLDRLRDHAGGVFFGSTPDISGAIGLATVVDRYLLVDAPVFLPGSSANSGAGRSGMKQHVGDLRAAPQTSAFADTWPKSVPPIYSVQTVWAHAALATLDRYDPFGVGGQLSIGSLHAQTLVHNPRYSGVVVRSLWANLASTPSRALPLFLTFTSGVLREAARRIRGLSYHVTGRGYYRYSFSERGISDVHAAAQRLAALPSVDAVRAQWAASEDAP